MQQTLKSLLICCVLILISACAPTRYPPGYHDSKDTGPTLGEGGYVKRGNPYEINGKMYYPLTNGQHYDEIGVGSWYGRDFHGKKTANGETYDMYDMTAAHTTLPMPSIVLVTNMDTGKSIKVRVNDRGPFVKNRLIDLSYSAARALGYVEKGTARVRVQTLEVPPATALPTTTSVQTPSKPIAPTPVDPVKVEPALSMQVPMETSQKQLTLAYIQIGAFGEKERADSVVKDLQAHLDVSHPPLRIETATAIFRVRLGPFDLDQDAQETLEYVRSNGYADAMIIHD